MQHSEGQIPSHLCHFRSGKWHPGGLNILSQEVHIALNQVPTHLKTLSSPVIFIVKAYIKLHVDLTFDSGRGTEFQINVLNAPPPPDFPFEN